MRDLTLVTLAIIAFAVSVISACEEKTEKERIDTASRILKSTVYLEDDRVGLCFAIMRPWSGGYASAEVECSKVRHLINKDVEPSFTLEKESQ